MIQDIRPRTQVQGNEAHALPLTVRSLRQHPLFNRPVKLIASSLTLGVILGLTVIGTGGGDVIAQQMGGGVASRHGHDRNSGKWWQQLAWRGRQPLSASPAPTAQLTKPTTRPVVKASPAAVTTPSPLAVAAATIQATPKSTAQPVRVSGTSDLAAPDKKDIAMQLVSSAENSSLNWRAQYAFIQDIGDGRGYTGGIIGFTSGTHDMLAVVADYTAKVPGNPLAKYLPALRAVDGTASHDGLGDPFVSDWKLAANDPAFQAAQNTERDNEYFNPAVQQAKTDGLRALGQFIYYDAIVMHGPGNDAVSFGGIRAAAMRVAKTPAAGGDEATYLRAFLDARRAAMKTEAAHDDTSRVDTEQLVFVNAGNFDLTTPLAWKVYGDSYSIN